MVKHVKENLVLYVAIVIIVVLGVAIAVNSIGIDALASAIKGEASGGCPSSISNFKTSSIVGASFSVNTATKTVNYYFDSLVDRASTAGVPGLIQYCIYPTPTTEPNSMVAIAKGADDGAFQTVISKKNIGFKRNSGNPTNIPLDGTTKILMGSAAWNSAVPSSQIILLYINDKAECKALYGGNDETCFVYPTLGQPEPQFGRIIVTKYNDLNQNGMQDAGEGALAGWDMTLYDSTNAQIGQGTTDANGQVSFADLAAGNYVVKETMLPFVQGARWANTDPGGNGQYTPSCALCCIQPECPTPSKPAIVAAGADTQVVFGNVMLVPT